MILVFISLIWSAQVKFYYNILGISFLEITKPGIQNTAKAIEDKYSLIALHFLRMKN